MQSLHDKCIQLIVFGILERCKCISYVVVLIVLKVQTGDVDMAIGGDQGGSVRHPASWCGIVGLKPTWGLVPYTGAVPIEITLDHLGPMARTVEDCALLLEVSAKHTMENSALNVQNICRWCTAIGGTCLCLVALKSINIYLAATCAYMQQSNGIGKGKISNDLYLLHLLVDN